MRRFSAIQYGGDYNPEQWPESVWQDDAALMQKAGVTMVTVGVFSWARLQPKEGVFTFDWLDRIIDLMHRSGIAVDLATATAAQPAWASTAYPDMLPVSDTGQRLWYGSRQSYCPNNPDYRRLAADLVGALVERYGTHPGVALWHINNEYMCHTQVCHCPNCARAFRDWLKARYQSLDRLNESWGTGFWSQHYYEWDEISTPRQTTAYKNPGQDLDFKRFMSDSFLDLLRMEKAIIKATGPAKPVTSNFIGIKAADYAAWAAELDIVSYDSYPDPAQPDAYRDAAFSYSLMRGIGGGAPWMLMEQSPSQVNWRSHNAAKRAGVMRLWSYQAVAHGADSVMFFQWRASRRGAEQHHAGMVPHAGTESRTFREVVALGAELKGLKAVTGSRTRAVAAMLFDYANWWALESGARPSASLTYMEQHKAWADILHGKHILYDVVGAGWSDFSTYRLIFAPALYSLHPDTARKLVEWVAAGGILVTGFASGMVDHELAVYPEGYPGPLSAAAGIRVEEYDIPMPGTEVSIRSNDGTINRASLWTDAIVLAGAQPIAWYVDGAYAGAPAVTHHMYGRGGVYYTGTHPETAYREIVTRKALEDAGLRPLVQAPPHIEATVRFSPESSYLFLLNHGPHDTVVNGFEAKGPDLISGSVWTGTLAGGQVVVLPV